MLRLQDSGCKYLVPAADFLWRVRENHQEYGDHATREDWAKAGDLEKISIAMDECIRFGFPAPLRIFRTDTAIHGYDMDTGAKSYVLQAGEDFLEFEEEQLYQVRPTDEAKNLQAWGLRPICLKPKSIQPQNI